MCGPGRVTRPVCSEPLSTGAAPPVNAAESSGSGPCPGPSRNPEPDRGSGSGFRPALTTTAGCIPAGPADCKNSSLITPHVNSELSARIRISVARAKRWANPGFPTGRESRKQAIRVSHPSLLCGTQLRLLVGSPPARRPFRLAAAVRASLWGVRRARPVITARAGCLPAAPYLCFRQQRAAGLANSGRSRPAPSEGLGGRQPREAPPLSPASRGSVAAPGAGRTCPVECRGPARPAGGRSGGEPGP